MTNRIVVLSCLVLAFALSIDWVLERTEAPARSPAKNEPDLYMLNASINQFDETGQLQHQIQASRFTHFPLTDLTTMFSPKVSLEDTAGDSPWEITANEGRILPPTAYREQIVELWDNVLAARSGVAGKFINIQTNSLTVYPDREYAETDQKVYIDNQTGRTTAAGMRAFLDTGKFVFFSDETDRVTTIFLPGIADG